MGVRKVGEEGNAAKSLSLPRDGLLLTEMLLYKPQPWERLRVTFFLGTITSAPYKGDELMS